MESNRDLTTIFESITDAFFSLDREWHFTYLNSEAERVLSRSREELLGKNMWDEFPEVVGSRFDQEYHKAMGGRVTVEFEDYHPSLEAWVEVKAYPSEAGLLVYFQDVNNRKRTEEDLRESERRLRTLLIQYSSDIVSILEGDGRVRFQSPAVEHVLGYDPEELVGQNIFEYIHPDDRERTYAAFVETLAVPSFHGSVEYRFMHKDGTWRYLETSGYNLLDDPEVKGIVVNSRDVTERERTEKELRESETKYRTLVEQIPAIVYTETLDGGDRRDHRLLYVSPQVETVLGYSPDEWLEKPDLWEELLHPEDRDGVLAEDARTERTGEPFKAEHRIRASDGRLVWLGDEAVLVRDAAGRPLFWHGVQYDVTERKQTEEKLRASEAELRALFASMNDVVLVCDGEGRCLRIASTNSRLLYKPVEEQLGKTLHEIFPTEKADLFLVWIRSALETQQTVRTEYSLSMDGTERWLSANISPMEDRVVWVLRDITERKKMEETLRESEERFRALVQNAPDVITLVDADNIILYDSPAVERILGYGKEERIGTRGFDYIHPDDLEKVKHIFSQNLESSGIGTPVEYRLRHKDGSWRCFEAIRTNLLDDPAVGSVVINYRDVTERKEAEKALRESEERHRRQAQELALLHEVRTALAQELDLPTVFRTVVEAIARTYGYTLVSAYLLQEGDLVLQHQVGYDTVIERVSTDKGVMGRVARTGRAVLLEDVRTEPEFLGAIDGIASEICVPLLDEGQVVGTLNVESTNDVKLTENDLRLMNALSEHVGIAIGRARLYTRVRESEERFRALVQNSSDLITLYDAEGTIRYVSPALERMLGYEPEKRIGATSFGLIHPDDVARAKGMFAEFLQSPGIPISAEVRAQHRDGSWRYIEAVGTNLLDHPSVGAVVLNGRDITDRKEAEARLREAERRYRTLVERIPAITYIQEPDEPSRTTYISPQYEEILGYSPEECLKDPEHWIGILHPDDRERVLAEDRRANATGDPLGMEYRQLAKDGSVVWIRDEAAAVRDEEGRLRYWIGVQIDITERKTLEERLEYQAFHDSLTGLPNRALFMNRLEHALSRTEREKGEVAVLFLDVDNLKVVNDTLGHEAGDWLLVAVTGRLRTCLRPADTVARLSGDEFAILLEDVEDVSRATQVAERVAEALRVPVALKERETFITASIGIALGGSALGSASGSAREQAESLLRQADLAMYRAKSKGKAHHEIFDPSMNASAFERLEMGNDLRRALERDEFRVYYQPKMRLPTSLQQNLRFSGSSAIVATPEATKETRIVGMEALVRWEHPERGLLSPEEFIPVAEESGLIVPIGRKVLEKACRQAQAWQDLYPGEEPLSMCVNISARQFQHPELTQDITRVLQQTGLEPRCLQLEITESVVMEDAHSTLDTLRKLEDLGVGLAIDDFGTGYSSLSYLKRFPVSFLKIDRLFVEPLGENPEDAMIVSGIISLAHTLGMKVVAEGVETAAQLAYLQGLGCDMAQGNYFCKPLQAEEASALFAKNSRR